MGAVKIVGRRALIGRGFLGSVLDQPGRFTDRYHSKNIDQLCGSYDLIVVAAPSAVKWHANAYPRCDQEHSFSLIDALMRCSSKKVVLLSTIDATKDHPYGAHRRFLEKNVIEHFENAIVIRLPALYGDGLKKNSLYDLLEGQRVANQDYHWYPVSRLWGDILASPPGLTCLYSAPLSMAEIADRIFPSGYQRAWLSRDPANDYNEPGPYTMSSLEVLEDIVRWVKSVSR